MAYNPSILDTNIISRGARESKIDLATPVNMFNSLQANKRANTASIAQQKLSDLTLSETEKAIKRKEQFSNILGQSLNENGTVNGEKAIGALNQSGLFDEANQLKDRMFKSYQNRQQKLQDKSKASLQQSLIKGKLADAVLNSENSVDAFMMAREYAVKNGLELSPGLLNYMPTDEEIADGRLDPKVQTELKFFKDKAITPKGPMSLEDKLLLMRERYQEKKDLVKTTGDIKADMPLTKAQKLKADIDRQKMGMAGKKLGIEEDKAARDIELFEQKKVDVARKNRSYKQKNQSQLNSIQTFLDKAYSISKSPDISKISGAGRFGLGGSKIPIWETKGKDLQADIDFLTDMGVIETMTKLKAESPTGSTGFGALSEKELMVMKNAFSLLGNPEISGKKKKIEVDRVIEIMERRAREQRAYDRDSEELLGPEKSEEETLRGKMKRKQ